MTSQELKAERESPRFDISDEQGAAAMMEYLREHGYAVIAGALSPEETATALRLLWAFLGSAYGMRENDVASWDKMAGYPNTGILYQDGIGQSELLWFVRGVRRVKQVFEHIWGTDRLLTSFDGAGVFRNWSYNEKWRTKPGWFHVDQNPVKRPGLHCVQGLVSLLDAGAAYGNLVVIPGSHKLFPTLSANVRGSGDFVRLNESQLQEFEAKCGPAVVVPCKAGDLVLWDSRVVHCNQPGLQTPPVADEAKGELWRIIRAVCYICMTPTSKADPAGLKDLIEKRVQAFRQQTTSTHWPHEMRVSANTERGLNPLVGKLTREQKALIFGASPTEEDESWAALDDRRNAKGPANKAPVAWTV